MQCRIFMDAFKVLGILTNDVDSEQKLSDGFWSRFVPFKNVLLTILASCKTISSQDFSNEHRDIRITDIHICFRGYPDLFSGDSDIVAYAVLEVRYFFSHMVTAPFRCLEK